MFNRVTLIGRLGAEPIIKEPGSYKVADLSLATTESYFDARTKTKRRSVDWIPVRAFGKTAEFCEAQLHKGDLVFIEGKLKPSTFTADGKKRWTMSVNARVLLRWTPKGKIDEVTD